jgi:hypothetical protein
MTSFQQLQPKSSIPYSQPTSKPTSNHNDSITVDDSEEDQTPEEEDQSPPPNNSQLKKNHHLHQKKLKLNINRKNHNT